jgi:hypothetical protein
MRTKNVLPLVLRVFKHQGGQVLPWVTLMMFALLGMAGLTVDVGNAYVKKATLQGCSNAAVLSAAEEVYATGSTGTANTLANQYSCGGLNATPSLSVQTTVATPCLNSLLQGTTCTAMNNAPNAIRVTETAQVNTYFMRIFGINSMNVSSTATAAFGTAQPYNIAFILDATPSLAVKDNSGSCGSYASAEQCAMAGMYSMLEQLNPCKGGATGCGPTDANTLLRVAIFSFPNISVADTQIDDCQTGGTPNFQPYTFPKPSTGYTELTMKTKGGVSTPITYLITQPANDSTHIDQYGFSSDYYSATGAGNLNASSVVVKILGNPNKSGCMKEPGNYNSYANNNAGNNGGSGITYQAGAIYAAQDALNAEIAQTNALGIKALNVIVFVSDGQANSDSSTFVPSTDTITAGSGWVTEAVNGAGKYPDDTQQCQQTIEASQYAQGLGTRVYGVAYGSETGGCSTDNKVVVNTTGLPVNITGTGQIVPCSIVEDMSSPTGAAAGTQQWYFYGDVTSQNNGCLGNTTTGSGMDAIFQGVLQTLTSPRLIANNAT